MEPAESPSEGSLYQEGPLGATWASRAAPEGSERAEDTFAESVMFSDRDFLLASMDLQRAVAPDAEEELTKHLKHIERCLESIAHEARGQDPACMSRVWAEFLADTYEFRYKQRLCEGTALHIAALHLDGCAVMEKLLNLRADITTEYAFKAYGARGGARAIHLAAGRGNLQVLRLLLDRRADVHSRSKVQKDAEEERLNYTALHEAAFFHQHEVVQVLLEAGANANASNMNEHTPLHIAARQGSFHVAKLLLLGKADLGAGPVIGRGRDRQGSRHTPLREACESARFPHHKLHLLARRSMEDLLEVASFSPRAALDMMVDQRASAEGACVVHPSWSMALLGEEAYLAIKNNCRSSARASTASPAEGAEQEDRLANEQQVMRSLDRWCELMKHAPQAAEGLLRAVTMVPEVANPNHHPLPRRAGFDAGEQMRCCYSAAYTWQCNTETGESRYPEWHDELAPPPNDHESARRECVVVKIKRLHLLGVMDPRLLNALASTTHLSVFGSLPVQAVVKYAWDEVAAGFYYANILYKVLEMLALILWVALPTETPETHWQRQMVWSVLVVAVCRDVVQEIFEVFGYVFLLAKAQEYFTELKNIWDWCCILPLLLVVSRNGEGKTRWSWSEEMVAVAAFMRWLQLCYVFRAIPWAGRKLMPILKSFLPMGGIIVITVCVFFGFLHAFLALDGLNLYSGIASFQDVYLAAFRMLFIGDGDGINYVLGLGGEDEPSTFVILFFSLAVLMFCICILNLFIAVHGEAYDSAQEKAEAAFIQERADICLSCFLRPHWPPAYLPPLLQGWWSKPFDNPGRARWAVLALALLLWLVLESVRDYLPHQYVPPAVLLTMVLFADAVRLQRPWISEVAAGHSLWICHRADFDASACWPGEVGHNAGTEEKGKLHALKSHSMMRSRRTDGYITQLSRTVEDFATRSNRQARRLLDEVRESRAATDERFAQLQMEVRGLGGRLGELETAVGSLAPAVRELVQELQRHRKREEDTMRPPHRQSDEAQQKRDLN